jgi:hypothetical protein
VPHSRAFSERKYMAVSSKPLARRTLRVRDRQQKLAQQR